MFRAVEKIDRKIFHGGKLERKIFTESPAQERGALAGHNCIAIVGDWRSDSF